MCIPIGYVVNDEQIACQVCYHQSICTTVIALMCIHDQVHRIVLVHVVWLLTYLRYVLSTYVVEYVSGSLICKCSFSAGINNVIVQLAIADL